MLASGFSDAANRADVEAFFRDKAPKYMGGLRNLAQSLEQIQLRGAFKTAQQESVNDFLWHYEPRPTIDVRPPAGTWKSEAPEMTSNTGWAVRTYRKETTTRKRAGGT